MLTTEPVVPLPGRPSLEQLKKLAKELQRASGGTLTDAQLQLARRHGFASWPKLRAHVETITALTRTPDTVATDDPLALVCLTYGTDMPERWARGSQTIKALDVWSAAALCDVDALTRFAADATTDGGPFGWEPLLYLCYARVAPAPSEADTLAAATFLLDNGADPNAGYLWHGLTSPFTALTGAFGGGEQGQPPHPHSLALARLLLERGADPNDAQALYNRMFEPNNDHLRLLFEFGLGRSDSGAWRKRLGPAAETVEAMFRRQLEWAAAHDLRDRVALLLDNGVDINLPLSDGLTAIDHATTHGFMQLVGDLYERGATQGALAPHQVIVGFVLSLDRTNVEEMLRLDPDALRKARESRPSLVVQAASRGSVDAVQYAVELGWDVNAMGRSDMPIEEPWETALHAAAHKRDVVMIGALRALGADPSIRDARFDGTPKDWAEHFGDQEIAELLD